MAEHTGAAPAAGPAAPVFQLESGRVWACTNKTAGWNLHTGTGQRSYKRMINFAKPFKSKPEILVSFALLDFINNDGVDFRLSCTAEKISTHSFELSISTWLDTEVWSCGVSWLAIDVDLAQQPGAMIFTGRVDFHKNNPGYCLHEGNGPRSLVKHVDLPKRFINTPIIGAALCKLDCLNTANIRVDAAAENVNINGFDAKLSTWSDSEVWSGSVAWIAIDGGLQKSKVSQVLAGIQDFSRATNPVFNLSDGDGTRSMAEHLVFKRPFKSKPFVVPFLSSIEVITQPRPDDARDLRINCDAENQTAQAFELKVSTWKDTCVNSSKVSWIAYGEAIGTEWNPHNADVIGPDNPHPQQGFHFPHVAAAAFPGFGNRVNVNGDDDDDDDEDNDDDSSSSSASSDSSQDEPVHVVKKQKTGASSSAATALDNLNPPAAVGNDSQDDERECKICFDASINTVIIPCGHLCVCDDCAKLLKKQAQKQCPICKQKFKDIIKTFTT